MKKIIISFVLIMLVTSLGGVIVRAEDTIRNQSLDIETKMLFRTYQFSSHPPKRYKGMILVLEKKNKEGYIGYYV